MIIIEMRPVRVYAVHIIHTVFHCVFPPSRSCEHKGDRKGPDHTDGSAAFQPPGLPLFPDSRPHTAMMTAETHSVARKMPPLAICCPPMVPTSPIKIAVTSRSAQFLSFFLIYRDHFRTS